MEEAKAELESTERGKQCNPSNNQKGGGRVGEMKTEWEKENERNKKRRKKREGKERRNMWEVRVREIQRKESYRKRQSSGAVAEVRRQCIGTVEFTTLPKSPFSLSGYELPS